VILAIDIGTSNFKSAVFDAEGNCLGSASAPLSIGDEGDGRYEIEGGQWLAAFESCCGQYRGKGPEGGALARVEALVISGNGPSLVPVTGTPSIDGGAEFRTAVLGLDAAPARLWLDRRAAGEAAFISALAGDYVDPGFFLPKALYIKNNEKELFDKTKYFLEPYEYLAYALTGEARTVFPSKGFERWYWNEDVLSRAGLDSEKFPPFISPGDTIGTLLPEAASCFGFRRHLPVIAGGPDFFAAILGSGAVCPGQVCDRSGSSEGINLCTQKQIFDKRLMSYGHPVKPYWNLSGIISTTGKAMDWVKDLFGISGYGDLYDSASKARPGAGGLIFLPYLAGERAPVWDHKAKGVWFGLSLSTKKEDLIRAAAEGICFAVRDVITVMEEAGAGVHELRVTGGTALSDTLSRIKADVTGRPVLTGEHKDAELLGLAALGEAGLKHFSSPSEAVSAMVKIKKTFQPDAQKASVYNDLFARYRESYRALKDLF
jgi:xylulokinase